MENKQERVLAYSMAKVIEHEELAEISGGMHWSHRETAGPSGSSAGDYDVRVDVTIDW